MDWRLLQLSWSTPGAAAQHPGPAGPAHLLWQAEARHMLAFALVADEPDFLMQFFDQGQLVTSIQLL